MGFGGITGEELQRVLKGKDPSKVVQEFDRAVIKVTRVMRLYPGKVMLALSQAAAKIEATEQNFDGKYLRQTDAHPARM